MTIHASRAGPIVTLTLDRPPVNALDTATWEDLDRHVVELEATSSVRCVIVAAHGRRAFSAGADIKEFPAFLEADAGRAMAERIHAVQNRLEALDKITIAAVEAPALGGGCELILACDFRVAGSDARFGFPEVTVGQFPGTGGTMRLPWMIGEARARELLLTGRAISASEARDIGLIQRVVPAGTAVEAAVAWAEELAELPRTGVSAVKQSITAGRGADVRSQAKRDSDLSEAVFQSPDAVEGYRAFVEKRRPVFAHMHEEH